MAVLVVHLQPLLPVTDSLRHLEVFGGGGGAGYAAGGGGGGYSGGGGTDGCIPGTGVVVGGSYNDGTNQTNSAGSHTGNGVITITPLTPIATTAAITSITTETASSGGDVTSDNGTACTAKGICWSTTNPPTISDSKTNDGSGIGAFTSSITGLTAGTTYYVRAYGTSSVGTGYGAVQTFTALKNSQTITFNALSAVTYGTAAATLSATGGASGNPVTFTSSDPAVASCTGG